MMKTANANIRPLSKPSSDKNVNLVAAAPTPALSAAAAASPRSSHHGRTKCSSFLSLSLALLWVVSVLTLTRFCVLELTALKKEISLTRDDSTTSSLLAAQHQNNGDGADGSAVVVLGSRNLGGDFFEESFTYDDDDDDDDAGSYKKYDDDDDDDDDYDYDYYDDDENDHDSRNYADDDDDSLYSLDEDLEQKQQESIMADSTSDHRSLPRLILHVGPSKSATTTLQTDLTAAYDAGWLQSEYAGRFYRPYYRTPAVATKTTNTNADTFLMLNRSESPLLVAARQMLHANNCARPGPSCCMAFRDELDAYYQDHHHHDSNRTVILSDEAFGNMWTDPAHFRAIHQTLAAHWTVTVVVGYRHFYEWILSSKYQRDRTDRISNQGKVQWPGPGPAGGRALLPLFPDTLSNWRQWFHYTDTLVFDAKQGLLDVRILDLHATTNSSILTQFLCAANLHEDCATSQQVDMQKSGAPMTVMNAQANTTVPSLYYDAVATMAAEQNLVNTSVHGRSHVREAVRAFHEDTNGLAPDNLVLHCPSPSELTKLLEYSLQMEQAFFVVANQQAHIDGFWAKANANAFCWVNATAVLNSQRWRDFFAENYY
jgi:hypothetical protein